MDGPTPRGPSPNGVEMLQARLGDPQVAHALSRILDRLEALEKAVDALSEAIVQLPQMTALAADALDESVRQLQEQGIDPDERMREGLALLEQLTRPRNTRVLSALLDRMDKLEQLVELVDQGPGLAAMAVDTVDESVRQLQEQGIDPDERMREGLALLEQLTRPRNTRVLSALLDRMDKLEQLVELVDQGPGLAAMAVDTVDENIRQLQEQGIDPDERMREGLALLEQLTRPRNTRVLSALLDRMDRLEPLIGLMDQGPGLAAMAVDSLDDAYFELQRAGVDLETLAREGIRAAAKLNALMTSPEYDMLLESGILEPGALKVVGAMGQALAEAQSEPPPRLGPWGLLRALGDANVQRATGFLIRFAQAFGARLG